MKVTVNQELVAKLNKLLQTPHQYGKYYYLEIDGYEFLCGNLSLDYRFELEDEDLLFYDGDELMMEIVVGETVELEFTTSETIITNETETYFGE